jgi:hypothetical protein
MGEWSIDVRINLKGESSASRPGHVTPLGREPTVTTGIVRGWASGPVRKLNKREISCSHRESNSDASALHPVDTPAYCCVKTDVYLGKGKEDRRNVGGE